VFLQKGMSKIDCCSKQALQEKMNELSWTCNSSKGASELFLMIFRNVQSCEPCKFLVSRRHTTTTKNILCLVSNKDKYSSSQQAPQRPLITTATKPGQLQVTAIEEESLKSGELMKRCDEKTAQFDWTYSFLWNERAMKFYVQWHFTRAKPYIFLPFSEKNFRQIVCILNTSFNNTVQSHASITAQK